MQNQQEALHGLALKVGAFLRKKKFLLATAESCTGGWIAQVITSIPSSSEWFERGFVTYSNASKQEMVGVSEETIKQFGAVSAEVAAKMAEGALKNSHAQMTLSVTGIAGPDGGTSEKPVGTCWFAWSGKDFKTITKKQLFEGDRTNIRIQAVIFALEELLKL